MYGRHISIKNYEPRQIRKKAAINSVLCENVPSVERPSFKFRGDKMEYTALYRKFRPKTFDEMVGQEHITRTLKNQIEELKKLRDELANHPKLLEDAEAEVRIKEFLLKERHNLKELLQF